MATRRLLNIIEHWHNRASDTNFVWFPFLNLKLRPKDVLNQRHVLMMTICFSIYFNAAYLIKRFVFSDQIDAQVGLSSQAYFTVGFLIWLM